MPKAILMPPLEGGKGIYTLFAESGEPIMSHVCRDEHEAVFIMTGRLGNGYDCVVHIDATESSRSGMLVQNYEWSKGLGR